MNYKVLATDIHRGIYRFICTYYFSTKEQAESCARFIRIGGNTAEVQEV